MKSRGGFNVNMSNITQRTTALEYLKGCSQYTAPKNYAENARALADLTVT